MRNFKAPLAALALCALASAPALRAADALAAPALPGGRFSIDSLSSDRPAPNPWQKRWAISLAPLAASQALDAASSYGMRELNPALAGPDGRFGMKAAGVKFGVVGGLIGVEYLLVKKFPRSAKFFTVVNWTTAGATTGLAIHNYSLPRR